jgi:hypothetical protein
MRAQMTGAAIALAAGMGAILLGGVAVAVQVSGSTPSAQALVTAARPGQTIVLPAGDYGTLTIANRRFAQPIRIDARSARFTGIVIRSSQGIYVDGGTIIGPGRRSYGVQIHRSDNVRISNMTITGAHRGIVMALSTNVQAVGNQLTGLISDGINVAQSQRVVVERNVCRNFNPEPAVYAENGALLDDGDHPDCIQGWSRPDAPPTGDVRVVGNRAEGYMQGVFFGNHVRDGINDGGFDRVVIRDNSVTVSMPNGIVLASGRDSEVINNQVRTVAGAVAPNDPTRSVKANLRITNGVNVRVCGNVVSAVPTAPGQQRC